MLGTPPALILSQDQTLQKCLASLLTEITELFGLEFADQAKVQLALSLHRSLENDESFICYRSQTRSTNRTRATDKSSMLDHTEYTYPIPYEHTGLQTYALLYCSVFKEHDLASSVTLGRIFRPHRRQRRVRVNSEIVSPGASRVKGWEPSSIISPESSFSMAGSRAEGAGVVARSVGTLESM